jgi:uncharacterized protein (DUF58 family)
MITFYIIVVTILIISLYIRIRYKYSGVLPVFKWIRIFYLELLTPAGRLLFWLSLLAFMFGMSTTAFKTYMVFTLIASIFLVSFMFAFLYRPKLFVTRLMPDRTTCGQKIYPQIMLLNNSWFSCYDIVVKDLSLPPEIKPLEKEGYYIPVLKTKEEVDLKSGFEFLKRGDYNIPGLFVGTIFPFGIWTWGRTNGQSHNLLVYPRFNHLDKLEIPVGKRYQPGGIALTSSLGESTEFIGNREFREGDNPRNIHWRSWARTGKPVVKEFQEEYFCRVALLLDTFVPPKSAISAYEAFESAISVSASVADYLSRQEYIIDIFAAGPNIYYMQAGRSLAYLENILDLLACLDVCPTDPFDKLEPVLMENLSLITTVVTVFLDWDYRREKLVRMITDLGTAVKVIIVRDGKTTNEPLAYESLVGRIAFITPEEEKKGVSEF